MREDRKSVRCDMCFGQTTKDIYDICRQRDTLPEAEFIQLINPMPTGDHWRLIGWVMDFRKCAAMLVKFPANKRDFIKRAADALDQGGFSTEISSTAARKFRDDNGLRMCRGRVFIFVSLLSKNIEQDILSEQI